MGHEYLGIPFSHQFWSKSWGGGAFLGPDPLGMREERDVSQPWTQRIGGVGEGRGGVLGALEAATIYIYIYI